MAVNLEAQYRAYVHSSYHIFMNNFTREGKAKF